MQKFSHREIFEDFYHNQPYEYRRLVANSRESGWKFFNIIYDSYFVADRSEKDLNGYIYFKRFGSTHGDLYLFKENSSGKTRLYHNSTSNYAGRTRAEMSIATIFLLQVIFIAMILGLIIVLFI